MMTRLILLFLLLFSFAPIGFGQDGESWFEPNRGQWDSQILYKLGLQKGDFFIEKDKFTYALSDLGDVYHAAHEGEEVDEVKHHTIHSHFINSSWKGKVVESDSSTFYQNYFLGNDKSKWQSKVASFKSLRFIDFYPGIDMILEVLPENLKYSFEIKAGVDPSIIQIFHEGMEGLKVEEGRVEIQTRFGPIIEDGLHVWNVSDENKRRTVNTEFRRNQDTVSFYFPEGYDTTSTLIIDPSLTFSTFTGSTADNWGFTAAPDLAANLYAGGIVFGTGYPISTGAYDGTFNGGNGFYQIDIGISKFSSDGTNLMYSTYIGGNGNETPNSIITNDQGELYILGTTASTNFPLSANAYQTSHNGGSTTTQISISFNGTDIVLARLSSDGSALIASTLLGGSSNDGINVSGLNYNYGDVFRGEIILDQNGDVLITSTTQSNDFPIVNGFDNTIGGNQDAIVAKFNPNLTTLIWSTYLGGSADDAGYSIQVSSGNTIYVSGGTRSVNFPATGGHQTSYQGGAADGFLVELNATTSNLISGTYIGTSQYDQSFFVQLDLLDRVYVFGQTAGAMTISPGVYSNPNSGQFIRQYSTDLSTLNWSTLVGGGNGVVEISPTAFLVSNCNEIYYTGWGGETNQSIQATGSTSQGFPTTANAYQTVTNGNNFYIGVLSENAVALNYGTFMGGVASSSNHVDGGTSRFDKQGRIYHAVCAACQGNASGFTTTPGAYSETNNSSNCNLAAWKFDLGSMFSAMTFPDVPYCPDDTVFFVNNSENGDSYYWDFGDGNSSTATTPYNIYTSGGIYDVMLVVIDDDACFDSDTSYLSIEVGDFSGAVVIPPNQICPGEDYQFQSSGGTTYEWSPASFLDDPNISNPTATINTTTTFTVIITDSCGADTLSVTLEIFQNNSSAVSDIEICIGDTVVIWAEGGVDYNWTSTDPSSIVGPSNEDSLRISPNSNMTYTVDIITVQGCSLTEQVDVFVFQGPPQPIVRDTAFVCEGDVVNLTVTDAPSIVWSPNIDINTTIGQSVIISTTVNRWYYIDFTNPCGTVRDSVYISIIGTFPNAGNDTIVCPKDTVNLWASGGVAYEWKPAGSVISPNSAITTAAPNNPTVYTVYITDEYGCGSSATVKIDHFPIPYVSASADYYGFVGDEVQLNANSNNPGNDYLWSPAQYLSCVDCKNTIAKPNESITYTVVFTDENGCLATDEVSIHFEGIIYVPNTFTPDGDGINDYFSIEGGNITEFHLQIFDRWGELIFESYDLNGVWNGTYGNKICQDGTYVWKIVYEDVANNKKELVGHVNLLR
ncbi:T9SS type B sorting domain-containing protein [Brumimicrobium glaciale]|uniref:T9SS type B sorting domain-containing protein n=1 Tax=Brumimicrobium glaciale TaxID=200475 RepID=A0A4Q4KRV6_9FLAO|nr:gliding motility-associated C-terminal domain-containing protein [Brumimicrobium glaciale]RYM36053.1 T9SS type B sorting domain-containing protein [Brumimicrobium glaciale]